MKIVMNKTRWTAILHFGLLLTVTANTAGIAGAQQTANAAVDSKNATDTLKTVDQLVEQNGKLEQQNRELMQQNRELMQQINSLRPSVANRDKTVQPAPAQSPSSPVQPSSPGPTQQPP